MDTRNPNSTTTAILSDRERRRWISVSQMASGRTAAAVGDTATALCWSLWRRRWQRRSFHLLGHLPPPTPIPGLIPLRTSPPPPRPLLLPLIAATQIPRPGHRPAGARAGVTLAVRKSSQRSRAGEQDLIASPTRKLGHRAPRRSDRVPASHQIGEPLQDDYN
jgi:hypothetical protein